MTDILKTKYQWLYTSKDKHKFLHYVHGLTDWDEAAWKLRESQFDGARPWTAACGLSALFDFPGLLSRIGAKRCVKCCESIGITAGIGCPVNDEKCELVK